MMIFDRSGKVTILKIFSPQSRNAHELNDISWWNKIIDKNIFLNTKLLLFMMYKNEVVFYNNSAIFINENTYFHSWIVIKFASNFPQKQIYNILHWINCFSLSRARISCRYILHNFVSLRLLVCSITFYFSRD